jgi:thioredoxin
MEASPESFETAVLERSHELPVIVDFWAPWCGPCHRLAPVLEQEIARRNGAIELVKVNVDDSPELASRYAVSGIPSVKAFSDGAIVNQFVGAVPPAAVRDFLDAIQDQVAAGPDLVTAA